MPASTDVAAERSLVAELSATTGDLFASLPPDLQAASRFSFDDPRRTAWDSGPRERPGATIRAMPGECRHLLIVALATGLSALGLRQALRIMSLETVLKVIEGGSPRRDPERYYLQCFGDPGDDRWTLRVEGHHLSVNLSIVEGQVRGTPAFRATNPARVPAGPHAGMRILAAEEDAGRALILALDQERRDAARIAGPPPLDTLTATAPRLPAPLQGGLAYADLDADQQTRCDAVIDAWLFHQHPVVAEGLRRRLDGSGRGALRFAWMGGSAIGEPHYWRLAGASLLIEFSMAQNAGNHIHAVVREPSGDFAYDLLGG